MIDENDKRIKTNSKYASELKQVVNKAFQHIINNKNNYVEYDWGMDRVQKHKVINAFDSFICDCIGFELDSRSLKHAHGIGNNSEYDIVDKTLIKVGSFYCNSDMFGGVYTGVTDVEGNIIVGYHITTNRVEVTD